MTPTQWQRVRDLFGEAIEREPAEARLWLAREAADDPSVASEVASLLEHHSQVGAFLAEPVAERVAHLLDDDPYLEPDSTLGPYTIIREIGRGGMGRVYLASDSRLGRFVALKALPPAQTQDETQRERLRREARTAAALTHPGICTIFALEELDGHLYIASEFIDGRSLREEISQGLRPAPAELETAAMALATALASAHERGITHRDLKPENVMRTRDGRLKILDFGLAIAGPDAVGGEEWKRLTTGGGLMGTPAYMAPELLKGGDADPRSDVFALGVLLYEYATGAHPFDAPTPMALTARVLEGKPTPLLSARPDLPPRLASVVDRSLRKAAAERFSSASEVVRALSGGVAPVVAISDDVARWWRTHQLMVIVLYLIACILAWQIKEWAGGPARGLFLLVGAASMIAGVFRGHLLFTERMNRGSFLAERQRAKLATLVTDLAISATLAVDGFTLGDGRPVAAVLTIALAIAIALTRLVVERATTRGAFGEY